MKTSLALLLASVAALAEVSPPQAGGTDTNQPASPSQVTAPAPAPAAELTIPAGNNTPLSYGLEDVVKMVQSGAGTDVVLSYIENSSIAYAPSAADVIRLHELGVPPQITVAILKHGGALRAQQQAAQSKLQTTTPAPAPTPNYSGAYNNPTVAVSDTDGVNYSSYAYAGYPVYNYTYPYSWWYASYPGFWFGCLWPYNNCGYYYSHGSWSYIPRYNCYNYGYGSRGYYSGYNNGYNTSRGTWGYAGRNISATPRANYSTMPINSGGRVVRSAPMSVGRGAPMSVSRGAPAGGMSRSVPSRGR